MKSNLHEAFKTAIEFEIEGNRIYSEVALSTKNPVVKKTFEFLARQELDHAEDIKNYDKTLADSAIFDISRFIDVEGSKEALEFLSILEKEFKEALKEASDDDIKAHEEAMRLEKESYGFYKDMHEKADDADLRKFLKFLMEQEDSHYHLLEKTLKFIRHPEHFHSEEERWHVDGG